MSKIAFKKTVLAVALTVGGMYGMSVAQAQPAVIGGWLSSDVTSAFSDRLDQLGKAGASELATHIDELVALVHSSTSHEVAAIQKAIDIARAELDEGLDDKTKQELTNYINDMEASKKKIQEVAAAAIDKINKSKTWRSRASIVAEINKTLDAAGKEIAIAKGRYVIAMLNAATTAVRDDAAKSLKALALTLSEDMLAHDARLDGYGFSRELFRVARLDGSTADDRARHKKLADGVLDALKIDDTKALEKNFYDRALAKFDVDIFFLSDNTGSMGGLISSVQTHAQAILDGLRGDARFAKVNAQFGVGRYLGDPSEWGENATSAYELLQTITNNDTEIKAAINRWYAVGGGDWPEGNFYAIQQAITDGEGTPRDAAIKTGQATGWRKGAEKVIVVFGDAPSWQHSVNEKELKDLARRTGARIVFIDTNEINSGSASSNLYDATNTQQMQDAALEIADASGGSYMRLTDLDKVKDAVLDSVYDALADNKWTGGMLAQTGTRANEQWRVRTPSSVTAESSDDGKTLTFVLRYPNQPESRFTVDATATWVAGRSYYEGSVADATDIFGQDFSASSVFHVNDEQDFFRFILRDANSEANNTVVEGYYGERLNAKAKLADAGVSVYDLRHRVSSPGDVSTASDNMKLFVNWATGKVYGIDVNAALAGGEGTALFVGEVDRDTLEIAGKYVFNTRDLAAGSGPSRITDARRETTTLQLYGKDGASGMGGTFGATFYDAANRASLGSMLMSGYLNKTAAASTYVPASNEVWKGFASGWVVEGGSVKQAWSSNPDAVQVTLRPDTAEVKADVNVRENGTGVSHGFSSDWTDTNVYANQRAFVTIKDIDAVPSYVATAGDDGYDYLAWGAWSAEQTGTPNAKVMEGSHWIAGTMTQTVDMPRSGTASYVGQVHGTAYEGNALHALNGTSQLTADFGAGSIGGQLDVHYANRGTAYATSHLTGVSISGNQFGGSLTGADNSGNIQGAFFGPNAAEVGGNWAINKNGGASQATGVFTGKKE